MVDRMVRVNVLIQREIGLLLEKYFQEGQYGMVTVTEVRVSRDLRNARVYISVFGDDDQKKKAMSLVNRMRVNIQKGIAKVIVLKHIPELYFVLDETAEKNAKLTDIFTRLEKEKNIEE